MSEEAFLLSCVQEVIKVWSSHGQANLNLSVKDGHAAVHLSFKLGSPREAHVPEPSPEQPQCNKYKCSAKKEKDRIRAAAHQQSKLQQSVQAAPAKMQQNLDEAVSAVTQVPLLNLATTSHNSNPAAASASVHPTPLSTSSAASANTSQIAHKAVSASILNTSTTALQLQQLLL